MIFPTLRLLHSSISQLPRALIVYRSPNLGVILSSQARLCLDNSCSLSFLRASQCRCIFIHKCPNNLPITEAACINLKHALAWIYKQAGFMNARILSSFIVLCVFHRWITDSIVMVVSELAWQYPCSGSVTLKNIVGVVVISVSVGLSVYLVYRSVKKWHVDTQELEQEPEQEQGQGQQRQGQGQAQGPERAAKQPTEHDER